jgi:Spy/CpxP family protein refolding chaperone
MKTRLMKVSLAAGLVMLLALPAAAYSQLGPPGPRFAPGNGGPQGPAGGNFEAPRGAVAKQDARRGFGRGRVSGAAFNRRGSFGARLGGPGGRPGLAGRALVQAEEIGLTEEQREQITAAQRGYQETSINRRASTQIAELELRDLMRADTPDIGAVEAKMRELSEHGIAQQTGVLRLDAAVGEILTAEQIDQLGELRRDRRDRDGRGIRADRANRNSRGNRDDRVSREGRGNQNRRGAPIVLQDTIDGH